METGSRDVIGLWAKVDNRSHKNVLRRNIRCNKSGSLIHPLVNSIAFLLWSSTSSSSETLGDMALHYGTGLAHWNIRRDHGHSANRPMDLAIFRPSFLRLFSCLVPFCSLVSILCSLIQIPEI
ncbi:hypothetical protein H5410_014453 [Solanum commersonii]|uniref:Uncharacterized protein n=1 Tax=Solanum commersonii TaxID=4109 RepID=A0A9J5ZQY4_SOLCO|nr:hypothetical protein H5410_014453 [Solanum commersonii]